MTRRKQSVTRKISVYAWMLLGLTAIVLCLWTAQQEWEHHSNEPDLSGQRGRRLSGHRGQEEYAVIDSLLQEIHGQAYGDTDNSSHDVQVDAPEYEEYEAIEKPDHEVIFYSRNNISRVPCPLYPLNEFVGRLAGLKNSISADDLVKNYPDVEKGGRVRPKKCTAFEKVAIIIPFRNRYPHLYILLNNLIPLLRRQYIDGRFFVIEQAMPTIFNRASLFNIGFLEALKYDKYDCFIFHDVDLIPLDDRNLYRCDENPMHFASSMDKYNYSLPYKKYFGGVVGFTKQQYLNINGNSNLYFGWGGEDDDLFERIDNKGYEIARPFQGLGRYDMVRHTHDPGNADNCDRRYLLKSARERQDVEGLNSIKYKRKYASVKSHMTWINVYIDVKEILGTAPDYVRNELKLIHADAKKNVCNYTRDSPIRD